MKLTGLFGLIALSCLAGSARAQLGQVSIHINNPLWVVSQDFNQASASQFFYLTGSGNDILNVNGFVTIGNNYPTTVNRAQSNVQGVRTGATPLSASASAIVPAPGGYMVFFWNGPGNGSVAVNGLVTPTGVLPAHQSVTMSALSSMTLTCGLYGVPNQPSRTSTAQVFPPSCSGKTCSVYNRLVLFQDAPINQTFLTTAFFYSQQGSASASCTLHVGDSAFEDTDVFTDFTANLN